MRLSLLIIFSLFAVTLIVGPVRAVETTPAGDWFLDSIHALPDPSATPPAKPIVIAIVDDGVRLSHHELKGFIWSNPKEVADNEIDDDGNGMTDDVHGWDISDNDNDVNPPGHRLKEYYHGTHLAGVIVQVARRIYGNAAPQFIKILPVKVLADGAPKTYIMDGYKGIQYAIDVGADVILCAWGAGPIPPEDSKILDMARKQGIVVVAAAGNFPEGREHFPAAHPFVLGVAGLDPSDQVSKKTNYAKWVTLSAPGIKIESASAVSDTGRETHGGTSQSSAMVAVAAALVKAAHPSFSPKQIEVCLKSSARVLNPEHPMYHVNLGAGKLDVAGAVRCDLLTQPVQADNRWEQPQGFLRVPLSSGSSTTWTLHPSGEFKGFWFKRGALPKNAGQGILKFYKGNAANDTPLFTHSIAKFPKKFFIPGTEVRIVLEGNTGGSGQFLLEYHAEPIDFSTLYCKGTKYIDKEGTFEDGSGSKPYSFHSNCKWLITAPEGKVIHFKFLEFDTQPKTDWLYFFNGKGTHEKIMAIFSGPNIPPELTTWHNQVLVWFVTDSQTQGQGWKGQITFVDKKKKEEKKKKE